MNHVRRFAMPVGGVIAALLLIAVVDASSASASPPVTTSSDSVTQNGSLTVSGKGCAVPDGSPTTVQVDLVNSFGDDEIIDTEDVASGNAFPDASGDWSITIHVAANAQSGVYDLFASCADGRVPATWTPVFSYADGLITVGATKTTAPPATESTSATTTVAPSSASATNTRSSTPAPASSASSSNVTSPSAVTSGSSSVPAGTDSATSPAAITSTAISNATRSPANADQLVATTPSVLAYTGSSDTGITGIGAIVVLLGAIIALGASVFLWRRRRGLRT